MFKSSKTHLDFVLKGSLIIKLTSFMETDIQLQQISVMVSYLLFFFKGRQILLLSQVKYILPPSASNKHISKRAVSFYHLCSVRQDLLLWILAEAETWWAMTVQYGHYFFGVLVQLLDLEDNYQDINPLRKCGFWPSSISISEACSLGHKAGILGTVYANRNSASCC